MAKGKKPSKQPPRNDLASLSTSTTTADDVTATLASAYATSQLYTRIGHSLLVAVAPTHASPLLSDILSEDVRDAWFKDYKTISNPVPLSSTSDANKPHAFELANTLYYHLRRTGVDQSTLFEGESGSGKTLQANLVLQQLCAISGSSKKDMRIHARIQAAQTVLNAFGNAKTEFSFHSSRYGSYSELQFNARGKMVGCKQITYNLEHDRVITQRPQERNFHVFYYLLDGATPQMRQELALATNAQFPYLNYGHIRVHGIDDSGRFEHLKDALKAVGLGKSSQHSIFTLLSTILHLGLIRFESDHYHHHQQSCRVINRDVLDWVAALLELDVSHLEHTLTHRTLLVNKENVTQLLSPQQASDHRDNLAKSLYSVLFAWLVEYINSRLCADSEDVANFIGLIDIPGFQPYKVHTFNHFVNNYTAERLHQFVTRRIFEYGDNELHAEGMDVPKFSQYTKNDDCINMLTRRNNGVVALLDKYSQNSLTQSRSKLSSNNNKSNKSTANSTDTNAAEDEKPDEKIDPSTMADMDFTRDVCTQFANNMSFVPPKSASMTTIFGIKHFMGAAVYAAQGFTDKNLDVLLADFVFLFRGGNGSPGSASNFCQKLFSESLVTASDPLGEVNTAKAILGGYTLSRRQPSMKREASDATLSQSAATSSSTSTTILSKVVDAVDLLLDSLSATQARFVFCLKPNDSPSASTHFEPRKVKVQVRTLALAEYATHIHDRGGDFTVRYTFAEFVQRYAPVMDRLGPQISDQPNDRARSEALMNAKNWTSKELFVGRSLILLRDDAWRHLENHLRKVEQSNKRREKRGANGRNSAIPLAKDRPKYGANGTEYSYDGAESMYEESEFTDDDRNSNFDSESMYDGGVDGSGVRRNRGGKDIDSNFGSDDGDAYMSEKQRNGAATSAALALRNLKIQNKIAGGGVGGDDDSLDGFEDGQVEELEVTTQRRRWIAITWLLTWWIPTFLIKRCGKMKRDDVRMAWREKVAIFIIIGFFCAVQLFIIAGLGSIFCPKQNILNLSELRYKNGGKGSSGRVDKAMVAIYGALYELDKFTTSVYHSANMLQPFAGSEITAGFPRTPAYYCEYARQFTPNFPPLYSSTSLDNGSYIQVKHDGFYKRDRYGAERYIDAVLKHNVKGYVGWDPIALKSMASQEKKQYFIINGRVYNLQPLSNIQQQTFLPGEITNILSSSVGDDLTNNPTFMGHWNRDKDLRNCFNNLFVAGIVDYRSSTRCQFTNYILLAFSIVLVTIIGFKFLAALQLSSRTSPEVHDKFVILQVPCYTEGEDSLRKCIDSLASMSYDDKRKLLFIICDGNIMGSGNDRPTPRLVLDILGVDNSVEPEPLSFQSLGEGMKQHNMGKVYSGLYEVSGHLVPYVVVVKVGTPQEKHRPGNRGKRDSQMILMRFLNKVSFDMPMSPLELEMYHQIKNVIGVDPAFYEYCLMIDADTTVYPDSLTRFVSVMMHDTKVMGVCGETRLSNEKDTWATMIQVYEYYISHHLAKAFESLFGSVTCLPGCFCMYRLRSPGKGTPLLISNSIIKEYGEVNVDTLHKKNLLALGEDRFLTTLMLKHFPDMRTVFTPGAQCNTLAPENWDVLLSQRRRWINSTVHNLVELLDIPQLCGFCCFSMRFIVFIDLLATLIQPALVGYLAYLIYLIIQSLVELDPSTFPQLSLILLAAIYGLQAIIFLIKREWQHVGWMIIYLLAIPVFSFFIPTYSFWHMDDFSWGSTRVVMGERGKKQVYVAEDEKFDVRQIPHKRWSEYEAEMLEVNSAHSLGSSASSHMSDSRSVHSTYSHISYGGGGGGGGGPGYSGSTFGGDLGGEYQSTGYSKSIGGLGSVIGKRQSTMSTGSEYNLSNSAGMPRPPSTGTNYSHHNMGVDGNASGQPLYLSHLSGFPTDEEIYTETHRILTTGNLMTITKKQVRDELSALFSVDLTPKRDYINTCITEILASV